MVGNLKHLKLFKKGGQTVGLLEGKRHLVHDGEDEEAGCGGEKDSCGLFAELLHQHKL